jgi:transposase-like protein
MTKRQQRIIRDLREENKDLRDKIEGIKNAVKCPYCLSIVSIRHGKRITDKGIIQRYECLSCHKKFMIRDESFRMRHDNELIEKARELKSKGYTLREISKVLGGLSHVTIMRWLNKDKDLSNSSPPVRTSDRKSDSVSQKDLICVKEEFQK